MRHADRRPSRGNLSLSLSRSGHTGLFPLSVMGMIHSGDSKNRPERSARDSNEEDGRRTGGGGGGNRGRELTWSDLTPTSRRPRSLFRPILWINFQRSAIVDLLCFCCPAAQPSLLPCPVQSRGGCTDAGADGRTNRASVGRVVRAMCTCFAQQAHTIGISLCKS